jgi:hypothetical protein
MAVSFLENIPNTFLKTLPPELSGLVDDVIAVLFERDPTRFLKTHYVPVDGTKESLVTFEFDREAFALAFDLEFRAAVRARGLELPRRDDVIAHVSHS